MELLSVFAAQATVAIAAAQVQRDTDGLLRAVLSQIAPDLDEVAVELRSCPRRPEGSTPTTTRRSGGSSTRSRVSVRSSDRETALLTDILAVVATHASGPGRLRRSGR